VAFPRVLGLPVSSPPVQKLLAGQRAQLTLLAASAS
jgi:hypothetical protein